MPSKANPINPLINADIICLFGHVECTFVSVFPNFGKINPISFSKILYTIPLDVYIDTYME